MNSPPADLSAALTVGISRRAKVAWALAAVYLLWGSTYLAMREGLVGFPPLLMCACRQLVAGICLIAWLRFKGAAWPTRAQWAGSALVGFLLLCCGNGGVATSEQWVASGLAAVMIAAVPLWAALFGGLFGRWPTRQEGIGLTVGACGVILLNLGELRGQPKGALILLGASSMWALGSVWSRRLDLPSGLMSSAAQMLCGGAILMVVSLGKGDRPNLSMAPVAAVLYLVVFGSIIGFSAYNYLLRTVSPVVATSYAFVNPVIAVLLGVGYGHEAIRPTSVAAMALVLLGVGLVVVKPSPMIARPATATDEASAA